MHSTRYREFLLILFYLTLASVPLSIEWFSPRIHVGLTVVSEPLMVLTMGVLALGLLLGQLPWPTKYSRLDLLIAAHFVVLLLATALSSDRLVSTKYSLSVTLYMLVGYGIPNVLQLSGREWRRAGAAFGLGTALLAGYVFARHLQQGFSYSISYTIALPFSANGHTNFTVQLEPLILGLSLLLLGCPWAQAGPRRFLVAAGFTITLMVVVFSYSRASFCSLLLQAGVLLVYTRWADLRRLLFVWGAAAVVIAGAWQVLAHIYDNASLHNTTIFKEMSTVQDFTHDLYTETKAPDTKPEVAAAPAATGDAASAAAPPTAAPTPPPVAATPPPPVNDSNAERLSRWKYCVQLFREMPVLGVGPGTFPDRYLDYVKRTPNHPIYLDTNQRMNAHNLYLNWLAEAGALGFITGVLLLIYSIGPLVRQMLRRPMPVLLLGLLAYYAFFLMHSLAQDFWQEPRVIVMFWLVVAWQHRHLWRRAGAADAPAAAEPARQVAG